MTKSNILIAGAGGIGKATGIILASTDILNCNIYIGDRYLESSLNAQKFIQSGANSETEIKGFEMPASGMSDTLKEVLTKTDVILDCLPGSQAPRLAQYAKDFGCHYANLTEYVDETNQVTEIAKSSDKGFILQTGLAPGFINVLGMHLYKKFCSEYKVEEIESLSMKVGALSSNARAPHFYAFTWSPIGVATEYIKDSLVVREYKKSAIPSLSVNEGIIINGEHYEDNFTSGGAADLPEALQGKVKNLDYKTLRHPGHYAWVKSILEKAPAEENKIDYLQNKMLSDIPMVEDDFVIVYADAKGKDHKGAYRAIEKSYKMYPQVFGGQTLRAIQTTTAVPLCESARLLLKGNLSGPVFQSQLDTESFMNGPFVSKVYK